MFETAALYLAAVNAVALAAFWFDKRAAEGRRRRVRESTLLWLAMIGGTSGAILAQQLLRHKTRKEPFRTWLWLIAGGQAAALAVCWVQLARR